MVVRNATLRILGMHDYQYSGVSYLRNTPVTTPFATRPSSSGSIWLVMTMLLGFDEAEKTDLKILGGSVGG